MASSFNKVILIGNMTADPEVRMTTSGVSVCQFSIAVNRKFKKENEQSCDFINIVTWRQQAEFVGKYFKKGQSILVVGEIQTRSWNDNNGQKRNTTEVIASEVSFVDSKADNEPSATVPTPAAKPSAASYMPEAYKPASNPQFESVEDDSLPF